MVKKDNHIKYYNAITQQLDHQGIIKAIKIAGDNYKRGYIIETHDTLKAIVIAIEQALKEVLE